MLTILQAQITHTSRLYLFAGQKPKTRQPSTHEVVTKFNHFRFIPIVHADINDWLLESNRAFYDWATVVSRNLGLNYRLLDMFNTYEDVLPTSKPP